MTTHYIIVKVETDSVHDVGKIRKAIIDVNPDASHGVVRGDRYQSPWQIALETDAETLFLRTMSPPPIY